MALSEIEKLERRYAENPQGLTFAPLAEVHRKNGDVPRALDLLRPGLTIHPDYIPASIVLGRCHLDLGDLPAAEAAFTHVLGLDGENVIALKALADITERLYRFDESERWLRTLLAIDRSNDDARDQLGRVEVARRQAETAASGAGEAAAATTTSMADASPTVNPPPMPELLREGMLGWVAQSGSPAAEEAMPLDLEELASPEPAGPPAEGIEIEEQVSLEEPVIPLEGLVGRDKGPHDAVGDDGGGDFAFETAEDIVLESSGGGEFQVANAAEELLTSRQFGEGEPPPAELEPDVSEMMPFGAAQKPEAAPAPGLEREFAGSEPKLPDSEPHVVAEGVDAGLEPVAAEPVAAAVEPPAAVSEPPAPEAAASGSMAVDPGPAVAAPMTVPAPFVPPAPPVWATPAAESPRPPELDLVLTESMAELLVQQGHPGEALTIYRHLERGAERPGRFHDKIAELEEVTSRPTPAFSVKETRGQSVHDFLRGVLGSRLPMPPRGPSPHANQPRPAADPGGAPTRPAHDSLSLSSVFGEESTTPTPPAVSTAGTGGAGGVSYDDFFGAPAGAAAPRTPRAPDPKSDDLDQFHAWLQNLKR